MDHREFLYYYRLIIREFIEEDTQILKEKESIRCRKENDIITQQTFDQLIKELNEIQIQVKIKISDKLNILENNYTKFIRAKFDIENESIDERDLMLLGTNLIFSEDHLQELSNKYKDNSKMQKIIQEYKNEPNADITIHTLHGYLDALKEFIENTNLGIHGKENSYWRIILENEKHLEAHLERLTRKLKN